VDRHVFELGLVVWIINQVCTSRHWEQPKNSYYQGVFSEQPLRAEDIVDGGCYCDDEANLAVLTDLGNELQRAGISYIGAQDAKYEYDGEVHMFTPELGLFRSTGSNGGEVLVTSTDLDQALERAGEDLSALRTDIEGFTGKAWTDALSTELTRGGTENQAYRVFRAEGLSVADAEVAVRATTVGTTA
jgi:hypothetical protein